MGDHDRFQGLMQFHNRLAFDEDGRPMFQVFSTCKNFIELIPALCYGEADVEDVNTKMEDHCYDECRYVMMANPCKPRPSATPPAYTAPADDPLDLQKDRQKKPVFYRY